MIEEGRIVVEQLPFMEYFEFTRREPKTSLPYPLENAPTKKRDVAHVGRTQHTHD